MTVTSSRRLYFRNALRFHGTRGAVILFSPLRRLWLNGARTFRTIEQTYRIVLCNVILFCTYKAYIKSMQLSVLHVSAVTELYRNPAVGVKVGEMGALRDGFLIRECWSLVVSMWNASFGSGRQPFNRENARDSIRCFTVVWQAFVFKFLYLKVNLDFWSRSQSELCVLLLVAQRVVLRKRWQDILSVYVAGHFVAMKYARVTEAGDAILILAWDGRWH